MDKPIIPAITAVSKSFANQSMASGSVVAVSRNRSLVHFEAQGFMDEITKSPMRVDTIFRMASSTKPVLGVAAMMMIEDQLFSPSDPIEEFIPEFRNVQVAVLKDPTRDISPEYVLDEPPPYRLVDPHRPITIHDLLTHTGGVATYGLGMAVSDWKWEQGETLTTWISKVASGPLDYQPGTRWAYSPTIGLDIVAGIIELVSGKPFEKLVQERIFDPLGMIDTHWHLPEKKISRLAVIDKSHQKLYTGPAKGFDVPPGYFSGSIGLFSTASDYLRFEEMLLNRGEIDGHRVLTQESIELMCSNRLEIPYISKGGKEGLGFGYTVEITLDPHKAHTARSKGAHGWEGYFGTISWTEPRKGLSAVIMVQHIPKEGSSIKDFHEDVTRAIHASI